MFRPLCLFFALIGLSAFASAQTPQTCPGNAEQILTNVRLSIGTPNQPAIEEVYNTAKTASEICTGRSHAQALAADILAVVASAANSDADKKFIWGLAHLAVQRSDQAYEYDGPNVTVTMPATGASQTLYTYGPATTLLQTQIMPNLLAGVRAGEIHTIFTTETLNNCPYSMKANEQARARAEATAINNWGYYQGADVMLYGAVRLNALKNACNSQTAHLTYALGTYYAKAAHYRSQNDAYPSKDWAMKAETLLIEFLAMELQRGDDRTNVSTAKHQLEKAQKVLGKVAP